MQKNTYLTFHVLIILISAISGSALAIEVGPVRQVYSASHAVNKPSSIPSIQIKWYPPENGPVEGYYVTFNTKMSHTLDEFNTAENTVELIRNDTQVTSQDFSGADDVNYYCHIAAFALDTNDIEYIGPTISEGPFRIDTVSPLMPVVNAPNAVRERMITIQPGAYRANEMYISNVGYELNGQWEAFAQKRQWELRDIQGNQMIYVVFRDLAGNTARASTAIRYDTIGPVPEFVTDETMPARSTPIGITIVFDEPVTQFSESDIQSSNCNIQNFISDQPNLSSRFFMECVPFLQGSFQLSILENVLQDEAGNDNQASDLFEWIYDISKPEIQPIADQMIIENAGSKSIAFSITNSHAFNGMLTIDVWADQQSLIDRQGLNINGQGNPFDITLTADASQTMSLQMTPKPDKSGETLIHIVVSDATGVTAHTSFQLNIWDAPNISPISDIQMDESTIHSISILLTDVYKQNLILSMTTSHPDLMGAEHITVIGPVFNSKTFPYNCQTSNHAAITLDLYFEPPKNKYGSVNLTLTATNSKDLSQTRGFKIDILPRNDLPEIDMEESVRCFEDHTAKVPVSITDIDQDNLVVQAFSSNEALIPQNFIKWIINGTENINPADVPLQSSITQEIIMKLQPTADNFGDVTVTVRVEDKGGFTEKIIQLNVLSDNDPPVSPEAISFTINENEPNGTKVGTIPVSDVDSPTLTYTIIESASQNPFQLNSFTGDITVNGTIDFESISLYHMTVSVSDGYSHSNTLVSIHVRNINDHSPQLDDSFDITIQENTAIGTIIKTITAIDIDHDPLSYTLSFETANAPFSISHQTGDIWIDHTVDYETESYYVSTISVSDGIHQEDRSLTITVTDMNEAPAISGTPSLTVAQGQEYIFQPITFDPDINDKLFYYISKQPEWADLDEETGKLSGIPLNAHIGIWKDIKISVRDKIGLSTSLPPFDITVINTNDPPVLKKPIANVAVDKNDQFSYTIPQDTFMDPDLGDTLTYQATEFNKDQLPDWLDFDPATRHFSGIPGTFDGGVFVIQVTALDPYLTSASDSFLLTVIDHNIVPQITLPSPDIEFYENNDAAIIDPFARVSDEDSLNFEQGLLYAYFEKNGTPNDHLLIKDYGFGTTPIGLDENKVYSGEQLIGIFSGGTYPEPLAVTFTHWADLTVVKSLLRNIMFVNDSDHPVDNERRFAIQISDGDGGTSDPVFKTIHVNAINDDPVLSINDQVINDTFNLPEINENESIIFENDLRFRIDDKDAGNGILTASISAKKGTITLDPLYIDHLKEIIGNHTSNVTFSGTLEQINAGLNAIKYTNRPNEFGTEDILFYMKDNGYSGDSGGEFIYRRISFVVNEVNEPPLFSSILPQTLIEDTPAQIAFSITETDLQKVTLQIKDYQQSMICPDSISLEGPLVEDGFIINTSQSDHARLTLNLMPCPNQIGHTSITLIVNDWTYTTTTQIDLYIKPINDAPVIHNLSVTIDEDSAMPLPLSIVDNESDTLHLTLVTPPEHGTVILDSMNKRFTYTPEQDNTTPVFFEYEAFDGELHSNIGRMDIAILPINDPPKIEEIKDHYFISFQTRTVEFSITDVDSDSDNINVSYESSNTQILPNNQTHLSLVQNDNNMYELYINPMKDQFGTTTITIFAQDSQKESDTEYFDIHVIQLDNTAPVISLNSPQIIQLDQNEDYHEPGYVAVDDIDGDITDSVTFQNEVDITTPGIYHVTYHVKDAAGNQSKPAERIVIVNQNQFSAQKISGNIEDDIGEPVGWVDIVVSGQDHTYYTRGLYDGHFELAIPITFDGSVWQMHLSRDDFYAQTIEFSAPRSFDKITLFNKESNHVDVIKGKCVSHHIDGSNPGLPQVTIRAKSVEKNVIIATSISDNEGRYTLAVDIRERPYTFEAIKYGYETKQFDTNTASTVILFPLTKIMVEQPESMTDHNIAQQMGKVTFFVSADPPFTDNTDELIAESSNSLTLNMEYIVNDHKYKLESTYGDLTITLRADTTEDHDASEGYFVEKTIHFKSIDQSEQVYVTKDETQYLITQPFYVEQPGLSSFLWIDRGGLAGQDIPKALNYTIRDYTFPTNDLFYEHVVEFVLQDSYGREIEMVDNHICLGIGFNPPITRDSLENQTYELFRAETVNDLLMGKGQVETSFTMFEKNVIFCTSHLSAFGFRNKNAQENQTNSSGDDSGGGCFLMTIPLFGENKL